jgi:hypothetical protein
MGMEKVGVCGGIIPCFGCEIELFTRLLLMLLPTISMLTLL